MNLPLMYEMFHMVVAIMGESSSRELPPQVTYNTARAVAELIAVADFHGMDFRDCMNPSFERAVKVCYTAHMLEYHERTLTLPELTNWYEIAKIAYGKVCQERVEVAQMGMNFA